MEISLSSSAHFKILAMSGSLRKASLNTAALRTAVTLAPPNVEIEIADISDLPLYNEDLRINNGFPPNVERLIAKTIAADAVLFAVPEYNYSVSAPLKNAIDWISRGPTKPMAGKPYAMIGVAGGLLGTSRAQLQMRQMMISLDAMPINNPQVYIGSPKDKFDANLNFIDPAGLDLIKQLLEISVALGRQLKA